MKYLRENFRNEGYALYLQGIKQNKMDAIFYLLIPLVLFTVLLYPLCRKAVGLLEILVNKYATREKPHGASENLKLLAYERIVLLIERLKPDSLIPRTLNPALSGKEYQLLLLNEIRKEFEYNLSQQLYLSEEAWKTATGYKDSVVTLINQAAREASPTAGAGEMAQHILERYIQSGIDAETVIRIARRDIQIP